MKKKEEEESGRKKRSVFKSGTEISIRRWPWTVIKISAMTHSWWEEVKCRECQCTYISTDWHAQSYLDSILHGARMAWYNTVQYSTVQHSTVQYNTLQHRIEQHCTYQHIILWRRPSWWVSQSSLWLLSTAEHQQADSSNAFAPTPIHKNSIN